MRLKCESGDLEVFHVVAEGLEARVYQGRFTFSSGRQIQVAIKRPLDLSAPGQLLWQSRWARHSQLPWPYFVRPFLKAQSAWGDLLIEPWIEGQTLAQLRARDAGWLSRDEFVLQLGRQLLIAWRGLQTRGLVHGDLSANNVMLNEMGGLAILDVHAGDDPGSLRLTSAFAAPERFLGHAASSAGDLYSVGRLLLYCQQDRELQPLVYEVWPGLLSDNPMHRHSRAQRKRGPQLFWLQARQGFRNPHPANCATQELAGLNLVDS